MSELMMLPRIITADQIEQGDLLWIVDHINDWDMQLVVTSIRNGVLREGVEFEATLDELRANGIEITLLNRDDET